jgi:hypothetical protein
LGASSEQIIVHVYAKKIQSSLVPYSKALTQWMGISQTLLKILHLYHYEDPHMQTAISTSSRCDAIKPSRTLKGGQSLGINIH